jgi:SAM-dependent methyltransferase
MWDEQAERFDAAADHGLRDPLVRTAWTELLFTVLPRPAARVADLGCGTGTLSLLLATAGYQVIGVDFSVGMIEIAKAKAAAADAEVGFIVGDAANPPLPVAAFDVILSRHVLWAMPDPQAALTRWVQLLRPAGRLILIEGRWSTGAGLTAEETTAMVRQLRANVTVLPLTDSALWGGPINDQRYLLVSKA